MAQDNNERLLWFAAGAALGATVAVLFAPISGDELREQLSARTGDGQRALADRGRDLYDRGRELYDRGRQIADDAAGMFEQGRRMANPGDDAVNPEATEPAV